MDRRNLFCIGVLRLVCFAIANSVIAGNADRVDKYRHGDADGTVTISRTIGPNARGGYGIDCDRRCLSGRIRMKNTRFYIIGFGILLIFDTWTQVSFKLATRDTGPFALTLAWLKAAITSPWIYGAIVGYIGAFITWMTLLKRAPIGPAFAASHLEVITVLAILVWFFGERLLPLQIVGATCIVIGIIFLSFSESRHVDNK